MWWPPHLSIGGFFNSATFMILSGLTLYNFLSSVFHGPGFLPLCWKPVRPHPTSLHVDYNYDFFRLEMKIQSNYNGVLYAKATKHQDRTIVKNVQFLTRR